MASMPGLPPPSPPSPPFPGGSSEPWRSEVGRWLIAFAVRRSERRATGLFLASIVYLPALLAFLALGRVI